MTLKEFISKLEVIAKERGDSYEVVMADDIPVVDPIFINDLIFGRKVVVTDQE